MSSLEQTPMSMVEAVPFQERPGVANAMQAIIDELGQELFTSLPPWERSLSLGAWQRDDETVIFVTADSRQIVARLKEGLPGAFHFQKDTLVDWPAEISGWSGNMPSRISFGLKPDPQAQARLAENLVSLAARWQAKRDKVAGWRPEKQRHWAREQMEDLCGALHRGLNFYIPYPNTL